MHPLIGHVRRVLLVAGLLASAVLPATLTGCGSGRSPDAGGGSADGASAADLQLLRDRVRAALPAESPVRVDWALDLEGRAVTRIWLPPAEADPGYLLVHTDRNELVAVRRETGIALWWTVLEAPVTADPAFTPYALYFVEDTMLTCLEIESGQVLWRLPLPFAASAGPTVQEVREGAPRILVPGLDRRLHALETETETWPPPGGTHYVTREDIRVDRIRLRELWHYKLAGAIADPPVHGAGRIFAADAEHRLYAVDPDRIELFVPKQVSVFTTQGPVVAGPARVGDFVVLGSLDRGLYAMNPQTLEWVWHYPSGHRIENKPTPLRDPYTETTYAACRFARTGPYGLVHYLDGTLAWEAAGGLELVGLFEHRENPPESRAVAVLANVDGSLSARGVNSGTELWRIEADVFGPYATNPRFARVFAGMEGGILCALERDF